MAITSNPGERASNIAEAVFNGAKSAGPTIVAILTMASLLGALTWILNQSLIQGDLRCMRAIDMLSQTIDIKNKRIDTILNGLIENAPQRIDDEGRVKLWEQLKRISQGVEENKETLLRLRATLRHQQELGTGKTGR